MSQLTRTELKQQRIVVVGQQEATKAVHAKTNHVAEAEC
jgi:hypothetical protein